MSIREIDGAMRFHAVFPNGGDAALVAGEGLLEARGREHGVQECRLHERSHAFPSGGLHIDLPRRQMAFWHADVRPGIVDLAHSHWPGWSVRWLQDDYETHLAMAGGRLTLPIETAAVLLDRVVSFLLREEVGSPVGTLLDLGRRDVAEGKDVRINPIALRDDRSQTPREIKLVILRRLGLDIGEEGTPAS